MTRKERIEKYTGAALSGILGRADYHGTRSDVAMYAVDLGIATSQHLELRDGMAPDNDPHAREVTVCPSKS